MKAQAQVLGVIVLALIGLVVAPVEQSQPVVNVAPQTTQITQKETEITPVNEQIVENDDLGAIGDWQDDEDMTAWEKKQLAIEGEIEEIGTIREDGTEVL